MELYESKQVCVQLTTHADNVELISGKLWRVLWNNDRTFCDKNMRTNCFFARRLFYDKTIRVDTKSDSDDEIFC